MSQAPHTRVFVLEDGDEDFAVIEKAFAEVSAEFRLRRFKDGDQCLDYFSDPPAAERLPSLLVLDLNTPGTDGREVLMNIKNDARLCKLPIVVLTSSANHKDVEFCYRRGANSYQVKPMDMREFHSGLRALIEYWLATAKLPAV